MSQQNPPGRDLLGLGIRSSTRVFGILLYVLSALGLLFMFIPITIFGSDLMYLLIDFLEWRIAIDELRILILLLGLLVTLIFFVLNRKHEQLRRSERLGDSLVKRIEGVEGSLRQSAALVGELQAELETRTTALERLRVAAKEHETLAALNADQAAAIQRLISATIKSANQSVIRSTLRQQIFFYTMGLVSAIPIGLATNALLR